MHTHTYYTARGQTSSSDLCGHMWPGSILPSTSVEKNDVQNTAQRAGPPEQTETKSDFIDLLICPIAIYTLVDLVDCYKCGCKSSIVS